MPAPRSGKRVTLVGPVHPFKGGIAQHTAALARELTVRGHEVQIETWNRQYPARLYPGLLTIDEPEFPPHPNTRNLLSWNRPDTWWRVGRAARTADLVVVAHVSPVQAVPYRVLLRAAAGAGRRAIVAHNVLPHERSRLDRRLVGGLMRAVDLVLTHGPAEQELAQTLTRANVAMAPIAPFLPPSFSPGRPLPGVHRRLLFFGLIRHYKGLDLALRALAAGPPDVQLRVAGEFWEGQDATHRLIAELDLGGRVEIRPGYVSADAVPGLFSDVDALVAPYRTATGSQAVWSAFQFGAPVIASDAGALAREITPGVDGLVVKAGDVASLTDAFHALYQPGVLEGMRAAVRPVDPRSFWDGYVDALLGPSGRLA